MRTASAQQSTPISATEAKSLFSDLERFPALVLAVSGGPDSTALMVLAARWRDARKRGPKLIAVTIDHAEYWDVKKNKVTKLFEMAKAAVTGTPPKMGEHAQVRMR